MKKRETRNTTPENPKEKEPKMPFGGKGFSWFYILLLIFILMFTIFNPFTESKEITWLEFERDFLEQGQVEKLVVVNKEVAEIYIGEEYLQDPKYEDISFPEFGPHYTMTLGSVESFENKLEKAQQDFLPEERIDVQYTSRTNFGDILPWLIPLGLLLLFWVFVVRRMSSGGGANPFSSFGKTTARISNAGRKNPVTFKDVAGLNEAKSEVMEVVDFLKNPVTYTKLGAKIPKGVLLLGPPGTGKTLIAKAMAGEANVPFFSLSGSEFVELFVGVGASRVRDLFQKAKEKAPSIIFIDEIDAVGRSREKVNALQSNDERENTLNQLLTELDGFGENTGVIVLAATNRPDILDKALLRPGRFDRHIYLELPNKLDRIEIFEVHIRNLKLAKDIDVEELASLSPGFSGADIANICNEAALIAARKKKEMVEQQDFLDARDRVVGGLERKGHIISPVEKNIVAYHEAGHAVASWFLKHVDSLVKVSIIPRGKSLGSAWYLPEERKIVTKAQFMDQICASLGGRASEDIIFNEISSGALDDLEKVTKQAYTMIAFYGLDREIGPLSYYDSTGQNERILSKPYSENMAELIDKKVRDLITKAYERTKKILVDHKAQLEELAQLLLKKEVLEKSDLERILGERNTEVSSGV
ncbi:MAG: ATP-dependent zinc metalloprotease FtsH [Salegentibacter sp.]|uniref:ATP-dependent zinc metalloprotease FtsH n=1 Tax=Salegentibacter sp. TaxID=1903072 RepID=UPI0028708B06|nr:ATP-dependent zinc metalloprotease FtsH [Salegentibacter sp.]MDR9458470.1 ATP-dependent zinc metalloprotease FtsH [Salegentibacter sp.]